MTFDGGDGMWKAIGQVGQDDADALVKAAFDAGINFFDTADVYSEGASETMLGKSLRNLGIPRNEAVIATKAFGRVHPGPNGRGASRSHLIDACKASLGRMGLDHIDLYQLHGFDEETPLEEQMEALDTLVRHGHVRYVGVSNWSAWHLAKAQGIAERKGLAPIRSIQSYYTLAGRELEREIIPAIRSEGVGLMVWSPLAGGYLSGKYTDGDGEGGAACGVRLSSAGPGPGGRRHRRDARHGGDAGRLGRADRAGVAAVAGCRHKRDRGGQAAGPADGQHRRDRGRLERGGSLGAR